MYTVRESVVKATKDNVPVAARKVTVTVSCVDVAMLRAVAAAVVGRAIDEKVEVTVMAMGTERFVFTKP